MTFITVSRPVTLPRTSVRTKISRFLALSRQRRALKSLDSRALEDLGLTRSQADAEASRPFWDAPATWRR